MLRALLADLALTDRRRIVTTIDQRLSPELPAGIEAVPIRPGSYLATFRRLAAIAGEVWIIAPETADCLATLIDLAERMGATHIGAGAEAVRLASEKLVLCRRMAEAGLPVPRTWPSSDAEIALREVGFPLVAKPAQGAGCEGVGLVSGAPELNEIVERAGRTGEAVILQEYVEGTAASASILCANGCARPLSLNRQKVRVERSFAYEGGHLPLRHPLADQAVAVACSACELIPGLKGYVGVDLILSPRGPFLIEVNPRLTTSYVGLRAATNLNLAETILAAVKERRLPTELRIERSVRFSASGDVESFEDE